MDKFIPKIEVRTIPNGYTLTFEGMKQKDGYMYFSSEKLLEGFMAHIGLEITDQLNMDTVQDFLVTAMNWKDNKECIKEIERLTAEKKAAERAKESAEHRMAIEKSKASGLVDGLKAIIENHKDDKVLVKEIKDLVKAVNAKVFSVDEDDV